VIDVWKDDYLRANSLSEEQRRDWDEKGFFIVRGFAPIAVYRAMHQRGRRDMAG